MVAVLRPSDLHRITDEEETRKMQQLLAEKEKAEQHQKEVHDAFMKCEKVRPDAMDLLMRAVQHAAEAGRHELMIMRFSSDFCTDGGRAINNAESDWPATLQGRAKLAMQFSQEQLQPLGYRLRAEILSSPGGMLGDVGLFLTW